LEPFPESLEKTPWNLLRKTFFFFGWGPLAFCSVIPGEHLPLQLRGLIGSQACFSAVFRSRTITRFFSGSLLDFSPAVSYLYPRPTCTFHVVGFLSPLAHGWRSIPFCRFRSPPVSQFFPFLRADSKGVPLWAAHRH